MIFEKVKEQTTVCALSKKLKTEKMILKNELKTGKMKISAEIFIFPT
jgi:hypothetical protein